MYHVIPLLTEVKNLFPVHCVSFPPCLDTSYSRSHWTGHLRWECCNERLQVKYLPPCASVNAVTAVVLSDGIVLSPALPDGTHPFREDNSCTTIIEWFVADNKIQGACTPAALTSLSQVTFLFRPGFCCITDLSVNCYCVCLQLTDSSKEKVEFLIDNL